MIQTYLAVMAGGAVGVGLRMFITEWVTQRWGGNFPFGTILVNISGCLIIGLFAGLVGWAGGNSSGPAPLIRQVVMIGLLGGYTTFSSFSLQTFELYLNGYPGYALANVFLTLGLCLMGTWFGLSLGNFLRT